MSRVPGGRACTHGPASPTAQIFIAVDTLEMVLAGGTSSESELASLQKDLEHEANRSNAHFGMRASGPYSTICWQELNRSEISMEELRFAD